MNRLISYLIFCQLCLKSVNRGKSQGKSGTGRLLMKCVGDWEMNKLSYNLAIPTIKKKASFTAMPLYFDDVKSDKFLEKITEGFDDGEVYETKDVSYILSLLYNILITSFTGCICAESRNNFLCKLLRV